MLWKRLQNRVFFLVSLTSWNPAQSGTKIAVAQKPGIKHLVILKVTENGFWPTSILWPLESKTLQNPRENPTKAPIGRSKQQTFSQNFWCLKDKDISPNLLSSPVKPVAFRVFFLFDPPRFRPSAQEVLGGWDHPKRSEAAGDDGNVPNQLLSLGLGLLRSLWIGYLARSWVKGLVWLVELQVELGLDIFFLRCKEKLVPKRVFLLYVVFRHFFVWPNMLTFLWAHLFTHGLRLPFQWFWGMKTPVKWVCSAFPTSSSG